MQDNENSTGAMEPLIIQSENPHRVKISEMAFELMRKSAALKASLPPTIVASLADSVRAMNCYYSNLIEGHNTHPIDIERALNGDYSTDTQKRNLQLEAKAHITVQKWIDEGAILGIETTQSTIREIHKKFYDEVPDELKHIENNNDEQIIITGGEYRNEYVKIGRHIPIEPRAIIRFMEKFESTYSKLSTPEAIISAAAAHHRLAWIHPFIDGNGRVIRLMSHATLFRALDTGAIWSISRGLARNVQTYKMLLANCDLKRRNDRDGRGTLSEEALVEFTIFFLQTCLDQVDFMASLMQPDILQARIQLWIEEEIRLGKLNPKSKMVIDAMFYNRGIIERGEIAKILNLDARQASRITSALIATGIISSKNHVSPLVLSFPAKLASRLMPGLFPDQIG